MRSLRGGFLGGIAGLVGVDDVGAAAESDVAGDGGRGERVEVGGCPMLDGLASPAMVDCDCPGSTGTAARAGSRCPSQSCRRPMWESVGRAACMGLWLGGNSMSIEVSPWRDGGGMSPRRGRGNHRRPVQRFP